MEKNSFHSHFHFDHSYHASYKTDLIFLKQRVQTDPNLPQQTVMKLKGEWTMQECEAFRSCSSDSD
jgi:hypothetical protein